MGAIELIDWNRKKYWASAALSFWISRIARERRDPLCWIFGAWHGGKYDDNSRYLFEYVNHNFPTIEAYWLSDDSDIIREVRSHGYYAELTSSPMGIALQKRAGFAFYTNGIDDFSYKPKMTGAEIVALWHGAIGQKNTWHMNDHSTGFIRWLKSVKSHLFEWVYRDFTCAVSSYCSNLKEQAFLIKPGTIHITGQPRNDRLLQRAREERSSDTYTILYMPTHGLGREKLIEEAVISFCTEPMWSRMLVENNARIVVKLHYLSEVDANLGNDCVSILRGNTQQSTQDILAEADMLITDYSSCAIDYALIGRPVLLYTPDIVEYTKQQDIGSDWLNLYMKAGIDDILDLFGMIEAQISGRTCYMRVTEWINEKYLDKETLSADPDNPFCASTIKAIVEQYPLLSDALSITHDIGSSKHSA